MAGSGPFTQDTQYDITPALADLTGSHTITGQTTSDVVLPFGQWVTASDNGVKQQAGITGVTVSTRGADGTAHVRSSRLTIIGLLAGAVGLALLATAVFLLFRRRRTVMTKLRAVRTRLSGALATQQLTMFERASAAPSAPLSQGGSLFNVESTNSDQHTVGSLLDLPQRGHPATPRLAGSVLHIPAEPHLAPPRRSLLDI